MLPACPPTAPVWTDLPLTQAGPSSASAKNPGPGGAEPFLQNRGTDPVRDRHAESRRAENGRRSPALVLRQRADRARCPINNDRPPRGNAGAAASAQPRGHRPVLRGLFPFPPSTSRCPTVDRRDHRWIELVSRTWLFELLKTIFGSAFSRTSHLSRL